MNDKFFFGIILGVFLGLLLMGIFVGIHDSISKQDIKISQETADVICQKLTGNETAIARDWWDFSDDEPIEIGELYCQLPSYDSTQKIKIGVGK